MTDIGTDDTVTISIVDQVQQSKFDKLPIELLNKVFSYLDPDSRNRIRHVQYDWNKIIQTSFGIKIVLHNHNAEDMALAEHVREIQVRNLTRRLPDCSPLFHHAVTVKELEIMGMILSFNLIKLLTEFENLEVLRLSRIYLETDRRLLISSSKLERFPRRLRQLHMRFLKTFHKDAIHINRRSDDLFKLTPSDNILLHVLTEFSCPELQVLELYHDLSPDVQLYRDSEMISGSQTAEIEMEGVSIQTVCSILGRNLSEHLKKIRLDNLPVLRNVAFTRSVQLEEFRVEGLLSAGWSALLENQVNLKVLELVLLDKALLRMVINVIKSNPLLESIAVIASTPNEITGQEQNVQVFDLSFVRECHNLKHLKWHYPPKIMDVSVLPRVLRTLDVCGNVQGILSFVKECSNLRSLSVEICAGPAAEETHAEEPVFFTWITLQELLEETSLEDVVILERGAWREFMNFTSANESLSSIQTELDDVHYRANNNGAAEGVGMMGPRTPLVKVPRLRIRISRSEQGTCEKESNSMQVM